VKEKGKCPRRGPRSRWEQQIRKDVSQRKGEHGRKLKGWGWSCGKPGTDGEGTHKVDVFHGAGGEEE
jgi:hypothetical protein